MLFVRANYHSNVASNCKDYIRTFKKQIEKSTGLENSNWGKPFNRPPLRDKTLVLCLFSEPQFAKLRLKFTTIG